MLRCYAVMGDPIQHSLSPMIHQCFAEQTGIQLRYNKTQIESTRFEQQVRDFFNAGGGGLNITLPCKQQAFAMSDEVSTRCLRARSANTLWSKAGVLYADNTDGIGLLRDLQRYTKVAAKRVLLIGAGGAARGVLGPLLDENPAQLTIANRTIATAFELQADFMYKPVVSGLKSLRGRFDLIINASSASRHGETVELPRAVIASAELCYDLSYQMEGVTPFVAYARSVGREAVDGLGMLIEQAAESFFMWHGVMPDTQPIRAIFEKNRTQY